MKFLKVFLLNLVFWGVVSVFAQDNDPGILTIQRIFNSGEFRSEFFGSARWLKDGSGYTTIERSQEYKGFNDLAFYEKGTLNKKILVSAKDLIADGEKNPIRIEDYNWSPDNQFLLIFTNGERVWRYNTRGDYWIFNLSTRKLQKLGNGLPESSLMFTKFTDDCKRVAFVCKNNIYSQDLASGQITMLTNDGSETIINGTTDWVYEEELHLRDAFTWSPDGKKIAFLQFDAQGIGVYNMLNTTDSIYSKVIPVQYPKVGTTNSSCKLGVINLDSKEIKWMNVPGDTRNNYIARLSWASNSEEVMIQRLNREQNKNQVMFCNAGSGDVKVIYTDENKAWLNVCDDVMWLDKGKEFTWLTERNGWSQLLRISRDGKKVKEITPLGFDVISVLKIDEKNGWIYYFASPENPTQKYLFRVDVKGKQKIERLTPVNQPGTHNYNISADADYAIHTYSNINSPSVIELVNLPEHKVIKTFVENKKLKEKLASLKINAPEFFRINTGEVELDGFMIKPYNFDAAKKYPVFFEVYGEPASQTVVDRFGGSGMLWHQMLAQKGYVVISIDNRGTPSPRGADFRKSIYKKIGILNAKDQAEAAQALIKKFSWIDADRIGVWGWSGGGSMTLNLLFQYPDIYKMGVSVAPVGGQWLYDTIYQERYMGLYPGNEEIYKNGSPVTYAKNLKGKLLLVHGTGDDNVHYQNAEVVINELIKHNKQFNMFAYPNRSHGIYEGEGTTIHLYSMITDFVLNNLEAGAK